MRFLIFLLFIPIYLTGEDDPEPLRVGMELSYPPFEMMCPNGDPCGISVDMANDLGKFLGRPVVIENISFVGLIPSLNTGKIDLIISSLTITEQREKAIAFSKPYAETGLCLLINEESNLKNIEGANDPQYKFVVKSGTSGELYAAKHLKKAVVRILDKESQCVLEVVQKKADAFIYDQLSVFTQWKKNPSTTRALLKPFQKEYWAIGIKKGDEELVGQVNRFLKWFKEEGKFDQLADKYLKEQKEAFKKLGVPFIF